LASLHLPIFFFYELRNRLREREEREKPVQENPVQEGTINNKAANELEPNNFELSGKDVKITYIPGGAGPGPIPVTGPVVLTYQDAKHSTMVCREQRP
jgi:hypothetical protein